MINLFQKLGEYLQNNPEDQFAGTLKERFQRIEKYDILKKNEGWQELEGVLKQELRTLLWNGIQDNQRAQVIVEILQATDTKSQTEILEEEIKSLIGS